MKGIYLAAYKDRHPKYNMDYNDIKEIKGINVVGDMLTVNLDNYDYIIASPPCNWWSRANATYKTSPYALATKHLLPDILKKLKTIDKPWIVENVRNRKRFKENGIYQIVEKEPYIFIYEIGRHTYFTNQFINLQCKQTKDFGTNKNGNTIRLKTNTQGGDNVHNVLEIWLNYIHTL